MNSQNKKKELRIHRKHNEQKPHDFMANLIYPNLYKRPETKEKKINQYITLKLEYGKTFIYVNGKRFIQCIRLILNIPKADVPLYDEVDSIDEAAKLYSNHLFQNRVVMGPLAAHVLDQSHNITPEEEFWGHCSNIQAWVEHKYDTRILMSNISFPLLRELSEAGDPLAKKVFKEEIALRLESGFSSVVQYLINQGYIKYFSPSEFKTVLESTNLIKNLLSEPRMLYRFLQSCVTNFPTLLEEILLEILEVPEGKNILLSKILVKPSPYFRVNPQFFLTLKTALNNLFRQVHEKMGKDIIDCIHVIENTIRTHNANFPNFLGKNYLESIRDRLLNNMPLDNMNDFELGEKLQFRAKILNELQRNKSKCRYCGKIIPMGQDTCDWCGHKKDDDEGGFFPYPYIFKPPGDGGGSIKRVITIPVKVKSQS